MEKLILGIVHAGWDGKKTGSWLSDKKESKTKDYSSAWSSKTWPKKDYTKTWPKKDYTKTWPKKDYKKTWASKDYKKTYPKNGYSSKTWSKGSYKKGGAHMIGK